MSMTPDSIASTQHTVKSWPLSDPRWGRLARQEKPASDRRSAEIEYWANAELTDVPVPFCMVCGRGITMLCGAALAYVVWGRPARPRRTARECGLVCAHCESPSGSYEVALSRIRLRRGEKPTTDSLYGWLVHLVGKPWWTAGCAEALAMAHYVAQQLPTRHKRAIPPKVRAAVLRGDDFACRWCGRGRVDGVRLHVDHIIPIAKGGDNSAQNLQTLCEDCNLGKGAS